MSQVRQVMQRGKVQYGLQRFIVDTPDDLLKLPAKTVPGSTAYVISTGDRYMHNSKNVWVKLKSKGSSSGGGGGGNPVVPDDDIWDGGDIDDDIDDDGNSSDIEGGDI